MHTSKTSLHLLPLSPERPFDSVLYTTDMTEFHVHHRKLSECSPYFRALYRTVIHSVPWRDFEIPCVNAQILRIIIDYAYDRKVHVNWKIVIDLYRAASQFKIPAIQNLCCKFICAELKESNCLHIIQIARRLRCEHLEGEARRYLLTYLKEVADYFSKNEDFPLSELLSLCGATLSARDFSRRVKDMSIHVIDPSADRSHYCAVVFDQSLYVIGGYIPGTLLSSCRILDLASRMWKKMAPMQQKRSSASAAAMDKEIYVFGGLGQTGPLRTAEVYCTSADKWKSIAPMNCTRLRPIVVIHGENIYLTGGSTSSISPAARITEMYNQGNNQWIIIDFPPPAISGRFCEVRSIDCTASMDCGHHHRPQKDMPKKRKKSKVNRQKNRWRRTPDVKAK